MIVLRPASVACDSATKSSEVEQEGWAPVRLIRLRPP
jgi:hypothetical protein